MRMSGTPFYIRYNIQTISLVGSTNLSDLLCSASNVKVPGQWMFNIGRLNGGDIQGPTFNTEDNTGGNRCTCYSSMKILWSYCFFPLLLIVGLSFGFELSVFVPTKES